ncbi:motility-associated protein [Sodalis sp.]|uniref:motility-associated protein n=1 Tax=Sodalis sp. (in: enterobacteria) TaxID=1898979 RepID=UPI003873318E
MGLCIFVAGNNEKLSYATVKSIPRLCRPSRYNKAMYIDIMALIYRLLSKSRQSG